MRPFKMGILAITLALAMFLMAGCYVRKQVPEASVALHMSDGASIDAVLIPGMYTDMGLAASLVQYDLSAISVHWTDASVLTADEQRISIVLDLTVSRKSDEDSILKMWRSYNAEARDNDALVALVNSRIGAVVKAVTTRLTLDQMMGLGDTATNRDTMSENITEMLRPRLEECGISLKYLGVSDIDPSESYLDLREQKANAAMQSEVAQQRTLQIQEQLKQEQAQTNIEMELARRANQVAEEKAKVYQDDRAFELEKLRLLSQVVGDSSKFYFVPDGVDLSFYLTGGMGIAPMQ